ncbi:type IV secretion system protein [Desulfosarcina cetonica]|uniref:type IV secretion system protein n=1 Tax=Desulfosarcina cetonica TaxID=90730 RepID=UPI0009FB2183|nr:type IV secretion system protein [Desulfosarcina cetonica]
MMGKKILFFWVCILLMLSNVAFADPPPNYNDTVESFNTFVENANALLQNIMNDSDLSNFVTIEWVAFSIILLVIVLCKYILEDLSIFDLINPLILILFAQLLIDNYDYLTGLCWSLSEGIASGIQNAAFGSTDPFLLPGFIHDVMAAMEQNDVSLWEDFWVLASAFAVLSMVLIFSIVGFFATTWAAWGYCLSKIIGLFFIPFVMFKKTAFLFDGWVRLFAGFLVYGVVARANMILAVLAVKSLYGIPGYAIDTSYTIRWDLEGLGDIMGMAGFMIVAILSMISTGRFAAAIVSGASGFGSSVSSVAYGLSRVVRGI